jgi:eukaryotic-like serine/threonine-protein kinase
VSASEDDEARQGGNDAAAPGPDMERTSERSERGPDMERTSERSERGPDMERTSERSERGPDGQRGVAVGDLLGRYQLLQEIGEGGMATVYRAKDTQLRREVAVKVLFPHLAKRPEVVQRFAREARAAANVEHRNILRILDVSVAPAGTAMPPYIVMELIRGQSLQAFVAAHGPLIAEFAAAIVAQLADALALAHVAGIVHRDVKPSNVMVTAAGQLLLADFGVAHVAADESLVTKTGALLGTPAYMSPEQASGEEVTAASDVYSLGVTLYQLVTGAVPFAGNTAKVLSQIAAGAVVPADRKQPRAGSEIARIIAACMEPEPARRPSAKALASELQAFAASAQLGDSSAMVQAQLRDPQRTQEQERQISKTLVARAQLAFAAKQTAVAMGLVERASQIDPADPTVVSLIDAWQRRGRRSSVMVIAMRAIVVGSVVLGGGLVWRRLQHSVAVEVDADVAFADHRNDAPADAGSGVVVALPTSADARLTDASAMVSDNRTIDSGRRSEPRPAVPGKRVDARTAETLIDATVVGAIPTVIPPPSDGTMVITMDTWCDLVVDGQPRGRWKKGMTIAAAAGMHSLQCSQGPGMPAWSGSVTIMPGQAVEVQGNLLSSVTVTAGLGASITIAQRKINDGDQIRLTPGRYHVTVWGENTAVQQQWVTISAMPAGQLSRCTLRAVAGTIECEP